MLRELKVQLTTDELLRKGSEIAEIQRKKELLEDEKKSTAASYKTQIDELEGKQSEIATVLRDRGEFRKIVCRELKDFDKGVIRVIRSDTDEEIEVHPMTAADRQAKLPLDPPGGEGAAKDPLKIPSAFEDVEPWQVWKHPALGEMVCIALAVDSAVFRLVDGETTRIVKEMWAANGMIWVRYANPDPKPEQSASAPAATLPQWATPDEIRVGQWWKVDGLLGHITIYDPEAGSLVMQHDDETFQSFTADEWAKADKKFVSHAAAPPADKTKKKAGRPKGSKGKKASGASAEA